MKWRSFHHPDICLPVIRRRLGEQLLALIGETYFAAQSPVNWFLASDNFSSRAAYDNAVHRLRKQGVIAYRPTRGRPPVLRVTTKGRSNLPPRSNPQRYWKQKWKGIWWVLVYDIPETERGYRGSLRRLLQRQRMGCLQKSVWVSARDIRAEFDDWAKAAAVDSYAYLFESRTVLGQKPQAVAWSAWDFQRLEQIQRCYCEVYRENLGRLRAGGVRVSGAALGALAHEALLAYEAALQEDPLLPSKLWPATYHGPEVVTLHRELMDEISRCAQNLPPGYLSSE